MLRIPHALLSSTTSLKLGDSACCVMASISMLPGTKLTPCSFARVLWRCASAWPQPVAKDYLNQVVLVELPRSASFAPHRLPRVSSPKETAFLPWSHPRELRCTSRTGPLPAAQGCVEEVHCSSTRSPRCPQSVVFPQVPRAPGLCCTEAGAPTMGPFVKLVFAVLLQPSHS